MKSFLLLLLSLMTGCEASSDVTACAQGWVEFICKYPETDKRYDNVDILDPGKTTVRSTEKDKWEYKGRFSLYHDTVHKHLRVVIQQLEQKSFGEYKCKFDPDSNSSDDDDGEVELDPDDDCQSPFTLTAYRTAKTTITCDYPEKKNIPIVKFFCKDSGSICEDILSTRSSLRSNGTFTLTETNSGFNMSISNVSSQHAGVYWCGVESNGSYRTALRKIQLKVEDITNLTSSLPTGQTFTYQCGSWLCVIIPVVICVALLVLTLVLVYKRLQHSKNTRQAEAQNNEDPAYEEIQEHPQKPGSGTALKSIYVTANAPTNPSASQYYSTINFHNSTGEVSGDTYSTVRDNQQCPPYSTVNHPSRLPEDSLYSTVNNPQQH